VLTWNVHGSDRPDVEALAAAIRNEGPDVVVIQEIRNGQAEALAAMLSMRYTWALKHFPYTRAVWWCAEGMAIMTPHTLDAAGHTEVSDFRSKRNWRRRIAQWALVGRADRSAVLVYNLHLSPHRDATSRRAEAARVTEIVKRIGDTPAPIVAGDFNDADDATIIDALPGVEHVVPPHTSPSETPTQLLDHVLLPPDAFDVSVSVPAGGHDWATMSDHLPLTVRFTLH
jgi:endonuclease/exonuclease/phosphatase family metal-dependent hydrolase